jgi:1-acyl-sn-glycerol-3-phosphate acyltransferase
MQIVDRRSEEHKLIPSKGVYIANHTCQMDVPAFLCAFTVYPIMKKQLLFLPLIGIIGWLSGALAVDRSSKSSRKRTVEKTIARLKLGVGIFFFPEGTRNKATREPKPFNEIKITLMKIAYEQNLPVTASSIYGTVDVFTPQGLLNIGTKVGIIVHHEIFPKDFASEEEFVRKAWQLVNEGYYELEKKLIDGPSSPSLETKRH